MTAVGSDGQPNVLLIQKSVVARQRRHTLKGLHFLAEHLFMLIININLNYFLFKLFI